jgi:hypothetical protein
MNSAAAPDQKPAPPDDQKAPAEDRVTALETGQAEIKAEQERQGGILETILSKVGGTAGPAPAGAQQATESRLERTTSIADQVKAAVKEVDADKAREQAEAEHAAHHAALKAGTPEAEKQPRERQGGWKAKLQKGMYGGDR